MDHHVNAFTNIFNADALLNDILFQPHLDNHGIMTSM